MRMTVKGEQPRQAVAAAAAAATIPAVAAAAKSLAAAIIVAAAAAVAAPPVQTPMVELQRHIIYQYAPGGVLPPLLETRWASLRHLKKDHYT